MVQVYTTNGRNYNDSIQENIVQKNIVQRTIVQKIIV